MDWTQTYPGRPSMLPVARAFVAALLGEVDAPRPVRQRATSVTAEYVKACISGGESTIHVTVTVQPGWARVAVGDAGRWDAWTGTPDDVDGYARSLARAADLADRVGHDVTAELADLWAEFGWPQ
jgi:hypothetical protein